MDRIGTFHDLQFFEWGHLPERLQAVSREFSAVAHDLVDRLRDRSRAAGADRVNDDAIAAACEQVRVALRHLLAAKDAAVRAALVARMQ